MQSQTRTLLLLAALALALSISGCADIDDAEVAVESGINEEAKTLDKLSVDELALASVATTQVQQFAGASPLTDVFVDGGTVHVVGFDTAITSAGSRGRHVQTDDGAQWIEEAAPNAELQAIHGAASPITVGGGGLIAQFGPSGWSVLTSPSDADLNDVFVEKSGTGYVIGSSGTIYRIAGNNVTAVDSDINVDLNAIWGTGGASIVVGDSGTVARISRSSVDEVQTGVAADLNGIWGTGGASIVVGDGGTILESGRNQGDFSQVASGLTSVDLNGIWGTGGASIVVGDSGTILLRDAHGNWRDVSPAGLDANLTAVHGSDPNNIFAVTDEGDVFKLDITR